MNRAVVRALRSNTIVAAPTDTIYGLLARAHSPVAVERLYALRNRDTQKPLIILISHLRDMQQFGVRLTAAQHRQCAALARTRRPTTMIVPLYSAVARERYAYLHRGHNTLAFRVVHQRWLRMVIAATGPLVAPSANPQGKPPADTSQHARAYFGNKVAIYCPSRPRTDRRPSRIVRIDSHGRCTVIRS